MASTNSHGDSNFHTWLKRVLKGFLHYIYMIVLIILNIISYIIFSYIFTFEIMPQLNHFGLDFEILIWIGDGLDTLKFDWRSLCLTLVSTTGIDSWDRLPAIDNELGIYQLAISTQH